jgi:hypothetical protein
MTAVQIEEDIEATDDAIPSDRERWALLPMTQKAAKEARGAALVALKTLVDRCNTSTDPTIAALAARYQQCKQVVSWFDNASGQAGKGLP